MSAQNPYDDIEFIDIISKYERKNENNKILKSKIPWEQVKNGKVVDLGTGDGWACRDFIEIGEASKVIGIDISKNSIETNIKENKESKIKYQVQDLDQLKISNEIGNDLEIGTFDFAFSAYVTHYLEDLESFFTKVYKLLKSDNNSSFLFSTEHPLRTSTNCIENKFIDYKFEGDEKSRKIWPISNYNQEGKRVFNWLDFKGIIKYHYTIATYINTLIKVGFTIDYLGEIEFSFSEFKFHHSDDLTTIKDRPYALFIKVSKK